MTLHVEMAMPDSQRIFVKALSDWSDQVLIHKRIIRVKLL